MTCYIHPKQFPTRDDMLSLVPRGGSWAEIGVFDGGFSQRILEIASPSRLLLIDLWADTPVVSGNVDGRNVREINGRELERTVRERFVGSSVTEIRRGTSALLSERPDSSMDAIYIDADHEYHSVRRDLLAAFRVIRDGGWLMGHDYGVNPERTDARWSFGVKAAVDDLCRDLGQEICAFGMDGCTSFAIQVRKDARMRSRILGALRGLRTDAVRSLSQSASGALRPLAKVRDRLSR